MSRIGEPLLLALHDELHKFAFNPGTALHSALGGAGTLGGLGMGAGALVGAGLGARRNYQEARQQGASVGQAALAGLGSIPSAASKGAIVGAGAGLAAGGGLGYLSPAKMESFRSAATGLQSAPGSGVLGKVTGATGAFSRFGQRQVHA